MVVALQWEFVVSAELFNVSICLSVQDLYWWYFLMCENYGNTSLPASFQSLLVQPWLPWVRSSSEFCGLSLMAKADDRTGGGDGARGGAGREQLTLPNPLFLLIKSGSFWGLKIYFSSAFIQLSVVPGLRPGFGSLVTSDLSRDFVPDVPRDPWQCCVREGVCFFWTLSG